ncbi:hypothetical protein HY041_00020 [Candidatus Roizmanbacteria bacterium]|nr:hypothetical protein [Candidatus Roizmanbacteria bacterium]
MLFVACFIIVVFVAIAIFAFPQFSPIPYFPANKKDVPFIIKAINLKNNQIVFDLGAGDGLIIFEAANETFRKKLNTQFVAVEVNPILLCIVYVQRLFSPNRKNIHIVYGNMFSMNFSSLSIPYSLPPTFYLYISPWHLEKTVANISHQFNHFLLVSYMYEITSLKLAEKIKGNKHPTFVYNI